jgi:hypothetical protein
LFGAGKVRVWRMNDQPLPSTLKWAARLPRAFCRESMTGAGPVGVQMVRFKVSASKSSQRRTFAWAQRLVPKNRLRSVE